MNYSSLACSSISQKLAPRATRHGSPASSRATLLPVRDRANVKQRVENSTDEFGYLSTDGGRICRLVAHKCRGTSVSGDKSSGGRRTTTTIPILCTPPRPVEVVSLSLLHLLLFGCKIHHY